MSPHPVRPFRSPRVSAWSFGPVPIARPIRSRRRVWTRATLFAAGVAVLAGWTSAGTAPSLQSGGLDDAIVHGALRFRNFNNGGGGEAYLGIPDLGKGNHRVELDLNHHKVINEKGKKQGTQWAASNDFTFSYLPELDRLALSFRVDQQDFTLHYDGFTPSGDLNYIQLTLADRDDPATVSVTNLKLGDTSLGALAGAGWNDWHIVGADLQNGFTLTGTLNLQGPFSNSAEKNKLEIGMGYAPSATQFIQPTAVPAPAAACGGLAATLALRGGRRRRGG